MNINLRMKGELSISSDLAPFKLHINFLCCLLVSPK